MAQSTVPLPFTPNFFHEYSVVLDHPISQVFPILGTAEGHERVCRLSGLCAQFDLLEKDLVAIPQSSSLARSTVRTLPAASGDDGDTRKLPRQFFTMTESVPILFGLHHSQVHLSGTFTWDEEKKITLYETHADTGIDVWKLREFTEVEGGKTRKETVKGHSAHMESYHTLF
ncbi:hypothetical protein AAF712_005061 [Marasmius tenuissimus]|uniref:Uncharacterized protein n=1 Tax=Marasmius tenuissimus TaxID=585030 RepID=A0ABR3A4H1_9AGAR